ncbi:uncharacterized protein NPIL_442431 [Nephila pilipes]|uniref:Uncharacterized protein n=1 Tax=Nephila pilipes TaxID=299642 RepID=A0A8X6NNF3_NEPPI|nr:uncharacterized protein NPIL_442431 [Nephila pilipes]
MLPYVYFYSKKESKIVVGHPKKPTFISFPKSTFEPKNFYISHWKQLHSINSEGRLPLNRLAYLKAKYRMGPFMKYKYCDELSVSFFRKLAQPPMKTNRSDEDLMLDCHPQCLVTKFTNKYLQYKSLLYYVQGIQNADVNYQLSVPENDIQSSSSTVRDSSLTSETPIISEEPYLIASDIAPGFEETEESERKRLEFEKQMAESRKKLEDVEGVFRIIKQGKKLHHTIRDEKCPQFPSDEDDSCYGLRRIFTFGRKKKKDFDN